MAGEMPLEGPKQGIMVMVIPCYLSPASGTQEIVCLWPWRFYSAAIAKDSILICFPLQNASFLLSGTTFTHHHDY